MRSSVGGHAARSFALLLGSTALTAFLALPAPYAEAQVVVGNKPPRGANGSNVLGNADADDGSAGLNLPAHTNTTNVTSPPRAYFGDARGADGGNGGTVIGLSGVEGGDGGNGGSGGSVNITNNAVLLTTGDPLLFPAHGMWADARGGDGGDGSWAAFGFLTSGGKGGNGGDGGTARAVAGVNSQIRTTEDRA
ncbi:MAG: hypothetical protein Q4G26_08805 [Paracoccus sp. (in: a-proteobacteria)]|nr:hypothetical protein [Paracoccus sp. (in: a-proteobacteria)]